MYGPRRLRAARFGCYVVVGNSAFGYFQSGYEAAVFVVAGCMKRQGDESGIQTSICKP